MTGVFGGGGRDLCPCGTGRAHDACCGALHRGERPAASAEELMRSRYAAYALGDTAYLLATWHPSTRPASVDLDPAITWQRLEVLGAEDGQPGDEWGTWSSARISGTGADAGSSTSAAVSPAASGGGCMSTATSPDGALSSPSAI